MAYTTINKPADYFNTVLWSGDGTSPRTITGVGFQPEWVWLKHRSGTGTRDHYLSDVVRGATKSLNSNTTDPDVTEESNGYTSAFASDGFTLTSGSNSIGDVNDSARTYVAWNWLADNTSGSSNTDGSITSSVSASTTSGFSIVSYTGTGSSDTVGHGLGVTPDMIILKNRSSGSGAWNVWHKDLTSGKNLGLHATVAESDTSVFTQGIILDTTITSSVFGFTLAGSNYNVNSTSDNFIAYCFAEKKGFSKFGSYTGNGNADGTFVYTGFKPAFLMVKKSSASGSDWNLHHNKSPGFNVNDNYLAPNSSAAEVTNNSFQIFDFCSNGFKCRGTGTGTNASGETHIYMAFASSPLVGSNNIPTTAR